MRLFVAAANEELLCIAMCCSMLQYVAACVAPANEAGCFSAMQCVAMQCSVWQCVLF
jgi:hypothetical protein